jgi:ABC-type anion transport system duplicated permease subunit
MASSVEVLKARHATAIALCVVGVTLFGTGCYVLAQTPATWKNRLFNAAFIGSGILAVAGAALLIDSLRKLHRQREAPKRTIGVDAEDTQDLHLSDSTIENIRLKNTQRPTLERLTLRGQYGITYGDPPAQKSVKPRFTLRLLLKRLAGSLGLRKSNSDR